jgi:elongation factor Tu
MRISLELIEMEIRDLLNKYRFLATKPDYSWSATAALRGEADGEKSIQDLLDALDSFVPEPVRESTSPS